ncbi:MAG TPA: hypothetical protein ENK08_09765 [Chloroflexi bacterium]|nr:hypothetical protein [Chloroflexota bacterium]
MAKTQIHPHAVLIIGLGVLIALILLPGLARARPALPPRPATPTPSPQPATPTPSPQPTPIGAWIALHAHFPPTWPWAEVHWQTPWTVVQWQDGWGAWHDVEGWQGTLDGVTVSGEDVVGQKTWWVAKADLGKGPFRWVVYLARGERLLGTSEPFDLPGSGGAMTTVEVRLADP